MSEHREPSQDDLEDESPEFSPTPPDGQQEAPHEDDDTPSSEEETSG